MAILSRRVPMLCGMSIVLACAPSQPGSGDTGAAADSGGVAPAITGDEQQDMATLDRLKSEVRAMARADGCTDASRCRAAPMGAKPCGGPWEYLVYCSITTDSVALTRRLEQLRLHEDSLNRRYQRASTCEALLEPALTVVANACRATGSR